MEELDAEFDSYAGDLLRCIRNKEAFPSYNPVLRGIRGVAQGAPVPAIACGLCRNDQAIAVDGGIYPCHRFVGLQEYAIGSIATGRDRASMSRVYGQCADLWLTHCSGCWARYECRAGCPWQHAHDDGVLRKPSAEYCRSIGLNVERNLGLAAAMAREDPESYERIADGPPDLYLADCDLSISEETTTQEWNEEASHG